jgi:hypothetical protein
LEFNRSGADTIGLEVQNFFEIRFGIIDFKFGGLAQSHVINLIMGRYHVILPTDQDFDAQYYL